MKKVLYIFLGLSLMFGCSDDESNEPCNPSPQLETFDASSITENTAVLNGEITLSDCTESITSQGFVYSTEVFAEYQTDNTVEVNGSEISATIDDLQFNTTYYYRTYLINPLGTFYGDEIIFITAEQELTYVPDDEFEQKIIEWGLDDVMDDYVITANLSEMVDIWLVAPITDFTGIEAFVSAKNIYLFPYLNADSPYIQNFDTSNLEQLELIEIANNSVIPTFETFDFSSNINLKSISVNGKMILESNLDLSNNTSLEFLGGCFYTVQNQFYEIDFSNNVNLKQLNLWGCVVPELSLSNNNLVEYLGISYCEGLNELDLSGNPNLTTLYMEGTQLESNPDLSNNINLEHIRIIPQTLQTGGFLTEIDVSNMPNLLTLALERNQLSFIDISNNPLLTHFYLNDNQLSTLDVTQNPNLQILSFGESDLTEINISQNLQLEVLGATNNNLTSVDVSQHSNLQSLFLNGNQLSELDVSNCHQGELFLYAGENNSLSCITASQNQIDNGQFYVDSNVQILTSCD